jgi:mRNA interferase HigB
MWIISKARLRDFWLTKEGRRAKKELELWYHAVSAADWHSHVDVKALFGARFDVVGDCAVFDIRGNDFRLVARIRFKSHKVFVLKVMTHAEYDNDDWKRTCGCFTDGLPKKPEKRSPPTTKQRERKRRERE